MKSIHSLVFVFIFLVVSFASGVNADELAIQSTTAQRGPWTILKKKSFVQIAQRSVENSPFLETRGTFSAPVKLFDALAVLGDVEGCPQWLFDCKYGEVLGSQGPGEKIYYTVIDAPFTFKDRDTVVHSSLCYRPLKQTLTIKMNGAERALPLNKRRVRVLQFVGSWELHQREDGWLDMIYQLHSNPQIGASAAVNRTMVKSVRETMRNVARLANTEPYKNSVPTDEEMAELTLCEN